MFKALSILQKNLVWSIPISMAGGLLFGYLFDARVTVIHVIPDVLEDLSRGAGINLAEHMGSGEWQNFNQKGLEKARLAIEGRIRETSRRVAQQIPRCPIDAANAVVKVGHPVKQILKTAVEGGYDLVVMGTHGHAKLEQTIIGSVAREVIRSCPVPVLVVRLPEDRLQASETGCEQRVEAPDTEEPVSIQTAG
jgi:nucleotide-binding universal stress UspA family protein